MHQCAEHEAKKGGSKREMSMGIHECIQESHVDVDISQDSSFAWLNKIFAFVFFETTHFYCTFFLRVLLTMKNDDESMLLQW